MKRQIPFKCGAVVRPDNSILYAWHWGGSFDKDCPMTVDIPDGCTAVELTPEQNDLIIKDIHGVEFVNGELRQKSAS